MDRKNKEECQAPVCYFDRINNSQKDCDENQIPKHDYWYQRVWRPTIAFVYILICIFDFIIMPIYVESTNVKPDFEELKYVYELESSGTRALLIEKMNFGDREWKPLTLSHGGLFHLAFGSIITGAVVTRGFEKRERLRNPPMPQANYTRRRKNIQNEPRTNYKDGDAPLL